MSPSTPLNYDSPQALRRFLDERGLGMRKMYGQNFLVNPKARTMLLDALDIETGARVWEIGPGLGAMTTGLLERGAAVTAFEIDKGFIAVLEELFGGNAAFTLVPGDVLKTWPGICAHSGRDEPSGRGDYLLGNLPYTIGAALLADFIGKNRFFKRMVVTVQKEVARRMAARPGSKDYSSFSVLCASAYRVTPLSVLKGASFYPEPRVDSQGVRLDLRTDIDPSAYPVWFKPLMRCLFSSRRKTVKNNLQTFVSSVVNVPGLSVAGLSIAELSAEALAAAGIPPNERAEQLDLAAFVSLSAMLERVLKEREVMGKGDGVCTITETEEAHVR
ncbi:ribosomal RNA small subunit methyltransferase A [Spirochaetia bacterium]|nr:ribosomal RNA small subunit methyltransferase A [Spirochaetia bacterium]